MPKGSKVLMADDDKMLLDMYKERLELAGYMVQSYGNGQEALTHVKEVMPDVIMLDVMMPKLNGYETLAQLKSDPVTKGIPVVMLSALMRDFNREKAVEGGAEDYLIKSEAMPSDVITKIEQVLQKYGKSAGGNAPAVPESASATSSTPPATPGTSPSPAPEAVVEKPQSPEVVFEPAATDTIQPQQPAPATDSQNAIETQPQVAMPAAAAAPASVQQIKPMDEESQSGNGGLVITLVLLLLLLAGAAVYFFLIKK